MSQSFKEKIQTLRELFSGCTSKEMTYEKIIEIGRQSPKLPPDDKIQDNIVDGCQSVMYLTTTKKDGKLYFATESEALISSGLATLLTSVYSGETPETILTSPPDYIEELGISQALTPNRANGLAFIHLKMKQEALKALTS